MMKKVVVKDVMQWSDNSHGLVMMVEFEFEGRAYKFDAVNSGIYNDHVEVGDPLWITKRNGHVEVRDYPNAHEDGEEETFWVEAEPYTLEDCLRKQALALGCSGLFEVYDESDRLVIVPTLHRVVVTESASSEADRIAFSNECKKGVA